MNNDYIPTHTLVDWPRLFKIEELIKEANHLPGIIAEVGVYKGGTARWICDRTPSKVLLFDTFEGMPDVNSAIDTHRKGDFKDTSIAQVAELLKDCNNYSLYKGVFPKQNAEYALHHWFKLVHIDVDIYESVYECLSFFSSRMTKGGIIILDDYNAPNCAGAKLATDEFCKDYNLIVIPTVQCQAIIRF